MTFKNIYWPDSQLEKIQIEYDCATLIIWNDVLQKRLTVRCTGLAGITNLCIWDDTIIMNAEVYPVTDFDTDFIHRLFEAYDKNYDYGGRTLSSGLLELRIELINHISFSVYCLKVDVIEDDTLLQ